MNWKKEWKKIGERKYCLSFPFGELTTELVGEDPSPGKPGVRTWRIQCPVFGIDKTSDSYTVTDSEACLLAESPVTVYLEKLQRELINSPNSISGFIRWGGFSIHHHERDGGKAMSIEEAQDLYDLYSSEPW